MGRSPILCFVVISLLSRVAAAETPLVWRPIVLDSPTTAKPADSSPYAQVVAFQNPTAAPASPPAAADFPPSLVPLPGSPRPTISQQAIPSQSLPIQPPSFVPVDGSCGCTPVTSVPVQTSVSANWPALNRYRPVAAATAAAPYTVGKGILGQPTLYVPGQPVRNFLRWLGP